MDANTTVWKTLDAAQKNRALKFYQPFCESLPAEDPEDLTVIAIERMYTRMLSAKDWVSGVSDRNATKPELEVELAEAYNVALTQDVDALRSLPIMHGYFQTLLGNYGRSQIRSANRRGEISIDVSELLERQIQDQLDDYIQPSAQRTIEAKDILDKLEIAVPELHDTFPVLRDAFIEGLSNAELVTKYGTTLARKRYPALQKLKEWIKLHWPDVYAEYVAQEDEKNGRHTVEQIPDQIIGTYRPDDF